jgi:uncharacterized protein YukE
VYEIDVDSARAIVPALQTLGEDAQAASDYISEYQDIPIYSQGIMNLLSGAHADVSTTVNEHCQHIYEYLYTTLPDAMMDTFSLYTNTDAAARNTLRDLEEHFQAEGNLMAETQSAEEELGIDVPSVSAGEYPQVSSVESALAEVDVHSGEAQAQFAVNEPPGVMDTFSITFYIRWAIRAVTEYFGNEWDPIDHIGERIAGDWYQFRACGKAYGHLADGIDRLQINLNAHVTQLGNAWEGNAYAACHTSVYDTTSAMQSGTVEPLRRLAEHYEEAAVKAERLYRDLEGPITALTDLALGVYGLMVTGPGALTAFALKAGDTIGEVIDTIVTTISNFEAAIAVVKADWEGVNADFAKFETIDGVPPVLAEFEKR